MGGGGGQGAGVRKRPLQFYFGKLYYHPVHGLSTTSIDIRTVVEQLVCAFKRIGPLAKIFWKQYYVSLNASFY